MNPVPLISVCICTFRREALLAQLLHSLAVQQRGPFEVELVVVDNDKAASARSAVAAFTEAWPGMAVQYAVESQSGVSYARNRTVALARGDYLAFIDDDEVASPAWLLQMFSLLQESAADTVLGPVLPIYPAGTPAWIIASGLFERPRLAHGAHTHAGNGRTCNALVRAAWCRQRQPACFDVQLAHSGGEDHDFFCWLEGQGGSFVWNDEATVSEVVPRARQSLGFILERNLRTSSTYWRSLNRQRSRRTAVLEGGKGVLGGAALLVLGLLALPAGLAKAVPIWVRAMKGFGRVVALSDVKMIGYGSKE